MEKKSKRKISTGSSCNFRFLLFPLFLTVTAICLTGCSSAVFPDPVAYAVPVAEQTKDGSGDDPQAFLLNTPELPEEDPPPSFPAPEESGEPSGTGEDLSAAVEDMMESFDETPAQTPEETPEATGTPLPVPTDTPAPDPVPTPSPKPAKKRSTTPAPEDSADQEPDPTPYVRADPSVNPVFDPTPSPDPVTPVPTAIQKPVSPTPVPAAATPAPASSISDEELAARVAYFEAGSTDGRKAVLSVILNRCNSERFGGIRTDVRTEVFRKSQFSVVKRDDFLTASIPNSLIELARQVLFEGGSVLPENVVYFRASSKGQEWEGKIYYDTIGGNCFFAFQE